MVIDSHQHFWSYSKEEFAWIDDSMSLIRRDFLPGDLDAEMSAAGVNGSVCVQARTCLEETRWLLDLADRHPLIHGVVGWLPLETLDGELEELAARPPLRGVREVMQGRPPGALLEKRFNSGVVRVGEAGLAYDILIFENQLEECAAFVDRHPGQTFILDHIAKPRIRERGLESWAERIRELSRRPNVFCKVSGMVTEADPANWTPDQLRPYFDVVLEAFNPRRLMFGSDWPVCLTGCGYSRWLGVVQSWCAALSGSERADLFSGTAIRAYQLKTP